MSGADSGPVRIGVRVATADKLIMACFVVTALASAAVWQARIAFPVDDLYQRYVMGKGAEDIDERGAELTLRAGSAGDDELRAIADDLVRNGSPRLIKDLVDYLFKKGGAGGRRLAVFMAEQGGPRWHDRLLLVRAGAEYRYGRFVERDYAKAMRYFDNPAVAALPGVQLQLGEVLLAEDNPARDRERGLELIRKSAEWGFEPAIERLKELGG